MLWFDICKDCEVYLKVFHWKSVGLHSCSDVDWLYTFYSPWFTAESKEGGGGGGGGGGGEEEQEDEEQEKKFNGLEFLVKRRGNPFCPTNSVAIFLQYFNADNRQ